MGATNCPETPRQRMIGMMYLVLTAMLALNVSKDILNAFIVVNKATEITNENFKTKIDGSYAQLRKAAESEPGRAGRYDSSAQQVRLITEDLIKYVESMKDTLFFEVDKVPVDVVKAKKMTLQDMSSKDNSSKPTNYFINQKKAYAMTDKIRAYKKELAKIVSVVDTGFNLSNPILTSSLQVDEKFIKNKIQVDWERNTFEGTVAAACYTLLNKTINEIRNVEFETVNYLYNAIGAASFKFDQVGAKVIPNSRIVFSGDKYRADIIVAAFDSKQPITVYYGTGRDTITDVENVGNLTKLEGLGVVPLELSTSSVGTQKFAGFIKMKAPDGSDAIHPFKGDYTVTRPSAAVAAEKMNVFYAGIPNPVTIAAPVAPEQLRINWGGASATPAQGGGGRYDVTVPSTLVGRDITISVSAELERGRSQNMGNTVFRVKSVPPPSVFVGGNISAGKQPKDAILANPFVSAKMDVDFNYQLPWTVVSYRVTFVRNGIEEAPITVNGAQFDGTVKNKIQSAPSGTIVEFSDFKIRSIAGERNITKPIVIRIR